MFALKSISYNKLSHSGFIVVCISIAILTEEKIYVFWACYKVLLGHVVGGEHCLKMSAPYATYLDRKQM